jgi:hypothetical protein
MATFTTNRPIFSLSSTPEMPLPDYIQTSRYEIRGIENNKCTFYARIVKADVKYSEDFILFAMKDRGETRPKVEQELSEERVQYQQTAGKESVCSFETEKLANILSGWWQKNGGSNFSTNDFEGANCQGSLFNFNLPGKTVKLPSPPNP